MTERDGTADESASPNAERPGRGRKFAACVIGAVVVVGLAVWGIVSVSSGPGKSADASVATAPVTYQVTGTGPVDITYRGAGSSAKATTVHAAHLPWKSDVRLPAGAEPIIRIVLLGKDSKAGCTLTVNGQHVQTSNTAGEYQRATCTGEAITTDNTAAAAK